jgi:hypothetical protein
MALRAPAVTASLILSAALAGEAAAVLAPDYYEEARRSAANHVQIAVDSVEAPSGGMGACPVEGRIVRVFRGVLPPGQRIAFTVSCYDYGSLPDGATLWTDYDALNQAKFLEAFMSADTPPRVVLDQVEIILAPRDRPYCDSNSLYCESAVDGHPRHEDCGIAGRLWTWLGIGAEECE